MTLRFSQRTAGGGTPPRAPELRGKLRDGWDPSKGDVDLIRTDQGLVTFDNTRVALAQELGIPRITGVVHNMTDALPAGFAQQRGLVRQARELGLPEPKTWGEALLLRTLRNKLPIGGTADRPRMPEGG